MNVVPERDVQQLTQYQAGTCVSIQIPTHVGGTDAQQDPIRLKNLLRVAKKRMIERGMQTTKVRDLLKPIEDQKSEGLFRPTAGRGLAIYLAPGFFRFFVLPQEVAELVTVGDSFDVKPLLSLVAGEDRFYVLALSQNNVRLFRGTRLGIEHVEVPDLPSSMAAALNYDKREKVAQQHAASRDMRGKQAVVFHGQGGAADESKGDIRQFCRIVNSSLQKLLHAEQSPLVLAAVDYLVPIYRQANTYAHLVERPIIGSPNQLRPDQLHERAWPLALEFYKQARSKALERFHRAAGTPQTSAAIETIVQAAHDGRVHTLFLDRGARHWGTFGLGSNQVEVHTDRLSGDEDLLNISATQTLINGGTVYALDASELPTGMSVAALFRY